MVLLVGVYKYDVRLAHFIAPLRPLNNGTNDAFGFAVKDGFVEVGCIFRRCSMCNGMMPRENTGCHVFDDGSAARGFAVVARIEHCEAFAVGL